VETHYRLTHTVEGFSRDTGKIVTVPDGALLFPTSIQTAIGLCLTYWGTQQIWIQSADLRDHAVPNVEMNTAG
jgi:hypothetical protein